MVVRPVRVSNWHSLMSVQRVLLVDAGCKVAVAFVHYPLDVRPNLLVVTGNVSAFRVVSVPVDVFDAVVVHARVVSATLVTIVHSRLEVVGVANLVIVAARNIHALSRNSGN